MKQWIYRTDVVEAIGRDYLDLLGKEGWEFVQALPVKLDKPKKEGHFAIFKRPVEESKALPEATAPKPDVPLKPWEQELKDAGAPLYREADIDDAYVAFAKWSQEHHSTAHFNYYQLPGRPGWIWAPNR